MMLTMMTVTRGKTHPMANISTDPDCVGSVTSVLSGTSVGLKIFLFETK